MAKPQIYIAFCEDAREEVGSKISLMGVLGPKLQSFEPSAFLSHFAVVVLCRFFETGPIHATLQVKCSGVEPKADDAALQASQLNEKMEIELQSPDDPSEWTCQIMGKFQGQNIRPGMSLEAIFTCLGEEYRATMKLAGPQS